MDLREGMQIFFWFINESGIFLIVLKVEIWAEIGRF